MAADHRSCSCESTSAFASMPAAAVFTGLLLLLWCGVAGCNSTEPELPSAEETIPDQTSKPLDKPSRDRNQSRDSPIRFQDITDESGVRFQWSGGPTAQHCMTEQNGGGIALCDYDNDSQLDIILTDCGVFDGSGPQEVTALKLFRNLGAASFHDVSDSAVLHERASAMGIAAGDFNSDGFTDLFLACYGNNELYVNSGDGTFSRVTDAAQIEGALWSAGAAFADLNGDGLLDLYVVNYVDWRPDSPPCYNGTHAELLQICSPAGFNAQPDSLYINQGDGTFDERGSAAGVVSEGTGKGLVVDIADYSGDGLLDVFVANDTTPNSLFVNRGSLSFDDQATLLGVAVSFDGTHGASMGVATDDMNRDGHFDLFVTNFRNQVNDLFLGIGEAGFVPAGTSSGINLLSMDRLAFGAVFSDFDLDGWPDLFVANGHIWDLTPVISQAEYQMPPDVLRNINGKMFVNVGPQAGEYFTRKWLGRSVAAGDFDGDAVPDLVVQHVGDPVKLLQNVSELKRSAALLTIRGTDHCRNPLGCRVTVSADEQKTVYHIPAGGSFQASLDSRITVAVPDNGILDRVEIDWPDGSTGHWDHVEVSSGSETVLVERATAGDQLPDAGELDP